MERKKEPEDAERIRFLLTLAGMAGLEPTISESKSGVLPLHYIPKELRFCGRWG